ncbi:3-deoxy-manno-octulosonate cytidylyltransferase [Orrella sp. NBD-18]|uniref:3-deoxy-manno-octulosonate cytidylyltransferase n=1 Tax=Sheuella amnicola TaxID=2707330 RepID=A0A6B2R2N3_9BURK|nr:3-deoxy-manno-octulosonate cytidylyltransferase [Sheuella amnicola]NDY81705.1 3-deoxy-manno-octulosonate cytidylyltransferase [Sheuella amnicola]
MSRFTVIIPAREASTRLPGKMLADLAGKPMVVRVAEQALASSADRVVIATDHPDIAKAASAHGIQVVLTRVDHPSGTDRLAEACGILGLQDDEIIVNVQGDEPLMDPALINEVAQTLASDSLASIATCAAPIADADHLFNPNVVKAVARRDGRAMYFSRAPIPWARDALADGKKVLAPGLVALHHIGMYAYRAGFLRIFPTLAAGTLEQIESLEQLRALEHGYHIALKTVAGHPGAGVDTPEDLLRVRSIFEKKEPKPCQ